VPGKLKQTFLFLKIASAISHEKSSASTVNLPRHEIQLIYTAFLHNSSVSTSQEIRCSSITYTNRLILFGEKSLLIVGIVANT
jgi:hypothetical protein